MWQNSRVHVGPYLTSSTKFTRQIHTCIPGRVPRHTRAFTGSTPREFPSSSELRGRRGNPNAHAYCSGACVASGACSEVTTAGPPGSEGGLPTLPRPGRAWSSSACRVVFASLSGRQVPGAGVFVSLLALLAGSMPRSMARAAGRRSWATFPLCAAGEEQAERWGAVGGCAGDGAELGWGRAAGSLGYPVILGGPGFLSGALRSHAKRVLLSSLRSGSFLDSTDRLTRMLSPNLV